LTLFLSYKKLAINCLYNLGSQGALIFIEGMTKDSNPIIRIQCALGLSKFGAKSIRTLAVGLFDKDKMVKNNIEVILEKLKYDDIVKEFEDKKSQRFSLKIALKDVLDKNFYIKNSIKSLFKSIINHFDNDNTINY